MADKKRYNIEIEPELYEEIAPTITEATGVPPNVKAWANALIRAKLEEYRKESAGRKSMKKAAG